MLMKDGARFTLGWASVRPGQEMYRYWYYHWWAQSFTTGDTPSAQGHLSPEMLPVFTKTTLWSIDLILNTAVSCEDRKKLKSSEASDKMKALEVLCGYTNKQNCFAWKAALRKTKLPFVCVCVPYFSKYWCFTERQLHSLMYYNYSQHILKPAVRIWLDLIAVLHNIVGKTGFQ